VPCDGRWANLDRTSTFGTEAVMAGSIRRPSFAAACRLRRWAAAAASAVVLAACIAAPIAASAATASKAPLPAIEVELWPDRQQGLNSLTVLGRVPKEKSLPATVDIPLPEGATVTWVGEIDEADATGASDTTQAPLIVEVGGGRAARIQARKTRLVQYEAILGPSRQDGTKVSTVLDWLQTVPTGSVTFSSRVPIDATQVKITPPPVGDPQRNEQVGQMLYTVAPANLTVGQRFVLQVVYELPAGGDLGGGGSPGNASSVPVLVFVLLAGAVAVLLVVIVMQSRRQAAADDEASDDELEEDHEDEPDDDESDDEFEEPDEDPDREDGRDDRT
jgi:hypothetical protein